MALKLAVGVERAGMAAAECALTPLALAALVLAVPGLVAPGLVAPGLVAPGLVALAQPAVSASGTAMAASIIVSRLDAIMPIRRAPAHPGSGCPSAVASGRPGTRCGGRLVLTIGYAS